MWSAHAHGPIQKIAPNLWRVESEMGRPPMRRAMDLVRRPNGEVWIHNGVALDDDAMREIEAWGRPTVLLVPSGYHRMDAAAFKDRYPHLQVFAPRGVVKRVGQLVKVDGSFDELPGGEDVGCERIDGINDAEGAVRVKTDGGTALLLCDAVFNMPNRPGVQGLVMRVLGSSGGPRVSRIFRTFIMKDRGALKASLVHLAQLPGLTRVFVQHEDPFDAATLRAVAEAL